MITRTDKIFNEIDDLVKSKSLTYIDAIVHCAELNGMEVEIIASMIKNNPRIKSYLQVEGEGLNLLPKINRLPI